MVLCVHTLMHYKEQSRKQCTKFYIRPFCAAAVTPCCVCVSLCIQNHELEFPRLSSFYCDVTDDKRKPAQRIVDQHNLYEETKFSLYRESSKGNLVGPSATERRLRKLLESDGTPTATLSAKTGASKDS